LKPNFVLVSVGEVLFHARVAALEEGFVVCLALLALVQKPLVGLLHRQPVLCNRLVVLE
jgi:hypothetical protein